MACFTIYIVVVQVCGALYLHPKLSPACRFEVDLRKEKLDLIVAASQEVESVAVSRESLALKNRVIDRPLNWVRRTVGCATCVPPSTWRVRLVRLPQSPLRIHVASSATVYAHVEVISRILHRDYGLACLFGSCIVDGSQTDGIGATIRIRVRRICQARSAPVTEIPMIRRNPIWVRHVGLKRDIQRGRP